MNVKRVGEIPMNFFPVRRGFHFISLTVKVNALGIPQWGMPGGFKWLVHYSSSSDSSCWISSCSKTCSVHSSKSFIKCRWMKPLHATWLLSLNNHLTGGVGKRRHIARGWSKDAMLLALLNISASVACCVSIPLWLNKMQKWKFKKRAPVYLIREI